MVYKIPKYLMIKQDIIDKINKEELTPNQVLPTERELIAQYNVSRITVRKAIEELDKEGYIYKIQGKGSFVKGDNLTQALTRVHSYTESITNQGMTPSRKVISTNITKPDKKRSRLLQIASDDDIFELGRIYYANEYPICYTKAILPYNLFPKIECFDFVNNSLYSLLEDFYGLKITRASQSIDAIAAPSDIANYLNIEKGYPVLLFRATTYGMIDNKEIPFETFKSYYKTDKIKYYIEQVR